MDQFSHEELQQVIVRYDGQLKKFKALMQEKTDKIQSLEVKVEQVFNEKQSIEEMMALRSDEINSLKQHMQFFMTENDSLKRLVTALEQSTLNVEDLQTENQQLKLQLDDIKSLNASLSQGDAETVYRTKFEQLSLDHEKLRLDESNLRQSLQRSNDQLSQLAQENEEMELTIQDQESVIQKNIQDAESVIKRKEKLIDQLKQRQKQFLDEKVLLDDKITALSDQIQRSETMTKQLGRSQDTVMTEHAERLRGKDLVIQDLNTQIRSINSKISSTNEKEIYYKRQIETMQRTVYELKQEIQATVLTKSLTEQSTEVTMSSQEADGLGVELLMNQLLEIQGSPITKSNATGDVIAVEKEESNQQENNLREEIQQLRIELQEVHTANQKLILAVDEYQTSKQESDSLIQELQQNLNRQTDLVQELERRRLMARNEVKQLLQKTPKVRENQIQQASLLQLRVLKKDLQKLYKDFLTSDKKQELEKSINDMVLNVNDCIQEAEILLIAQATSS